MDLGKDLVAASATPLVLAILAEGDSYGYAIIRRVNELSSGRLQLPQTASAIPFACAQNWHVRFMGLNCS